jgi:hypothetical protein
LKFASFLIALRRPTALSGLKDYRRAEPLTIGALTITSAMFLAWSVTLCLSGGLVRHLPETPQRWTILVSGATATAPDNEVSLARLFINGRRAQSENLHFTGNWERGLDWAAQLNDRNTAKRSGYWKWWTSSPGWEARWNHPNTSETASVSFSGRSAAILFDRLGHCGHLSISNEAGRIWQDSCPRSRARYKSYVPVDLPVPAAPSRWLFAVWLIVFFAVAAVIRPWTDNRPLERWLIIYLVFLQFLAWSTQSAGIVYDSLGEMPTVKQWTLGYPGYMPPGYPLLVAFGYLISTTAAGSVLTFVQHLMMVATICWCVRLVQRSVGAPLAFPAGLVMGAVAPMLFLPQTLQSENVAMFGMAGALYFAVCYRDRGRTRDAIWSGLLLAWGGMARIAPFAAGMLAIFVVMLGIKPIVIGLKRFGTIIAVVVLVIAVPISWFGVRSGHFTLSSSVGHHLYDRVVSGEGLLDEMAPMTSRFLQLLAPLSAKDIADIRVAPGRHPDLENILKTKGLDYWDIEPLMRGVAWEGIRKAPTAFVVFSFQEAWTQYLDDPTPMLSWWAVPPVYPKELESAPILRVRANSLLWREVLGEQFAIIWTYTPWLALAGLITLSLLCERLLFLGLALIPFGYILSLAFLELEVPRYTVAIIPFVLALAAGPFAAVVALLCQSLEYRETRGCRPSATDE